MSELVLVTGAAGYVGSVLCEHLLHAGFSVRALDKITFEPSLFHLCANPRFDFILGDVRDEALMETRWMEVGTAIEAAEAQIGALD